MTAFLNAVNPFKFTLFMACFANFDFTDKILLFCQAISEPIAWNYLPNTLICKQLDIL